MVTLRVSRLEFSFSISDLIRKNEVFEEKMAANLGRRFARVSGDFNLQHLFAWTARLAGFKQTIVHGQWTIARCLAHLQSSGNALQ